VRLADVANRTSVRDVFRPGSMLWKNKRSGDDNGSCRLGGPNERASGQVLTSGAGLMLLLRCPRRSPAV
jgi:hypothetical protein